MSRCPATVHWHELDLDRRCIRRAGHDGLHRDGVWWFTSEGLRAPATVEQPDRAEFTAAAILEAAAR